MTEDKGSVKNGEAAAEMAPQEDGTKIPLEQDNILPPDVEVKFSSNSPNGDAKIDIGEPQAFSGLSKEELMKYANDPFWKGLRKVLFILFWVCWFAMLAGALYTIFTAPSCAKLERNLMEKSPILDLPAESDINADDFVSLAESLGISTVKLQGVIDALNFEKSTVPAEFLEALTNKSITVGTDFVPAQLPEDNTWFSDPAKNPTWFKPGSSTLDFTKAVVIQAVLDLLKDTWLPKGVRGFFVPTDASEEVMAAGKMLNTNLTEHDGFVITSLVDTDGEIVEGMTGESLKSLIVNAGSDDVWPYYQYNLASAITRLGAEKASLVTTVLLLAPGTPLLTGLAVANSSALEPTTVGLIKELSSLRLSQAALQIGNVQFLNATEDALGFMRVAKGAPGFAVAVNLNAAANATLDFSQLKGVSEDLAASVKIPSTGELAESKLDLSSVHLEPLQGLVLQFVPKA